MSLVRILFLAILSFCGFLQAEESQPDHPIRLAFVGDSITQGAGLKDPDKEAKHLPPETINLAASLRPSAIKSSRDGRITIAGTTATAAPSSVQIRVTTSHGQTSAATVAAAGSTFTCIYPDDFPNAPKLTAMLLYVDAGTGKTANDIVVQAEITLIVTAADGSPPDLPLVFMDDFTDAGGGLDSACAQWSRNRVLVNLFMHSRAAQLMRIAQPHFDLATPADLQWFRTHASLYDFDHRDRDWRTPLKNRVARGFWQAVWNTWFNASNDHHWDGDLANNRPDNFRPYTFTNDLADLLVLYQMLRPVPPALLDNRLALSGQVLQNLLSLQHRNPKNFALLEKTGKQEFYTAGAFRYGMFESGEWLTEKTGWFANPDFRDFAHGGVFNGRAIWALGESLKAKPDDPQAAPVRTALALAVKYCLHDAEEHRYTWRSKSGLPIWNRTAGEHAYLLLGMLAACTVVPDLPIAVDPILPPEPLQAVTIRALDALAESVDANGSWSRYANATAMNIAALAEGVRTFPKHRSAPVWRAAAVKAADGWLALQPQPSKRAAPSPMFGHMQKDGGTTFELDSHSPPHVSLYIGGHWLHALAVLHAVTQEPKYAVRAQAILAYYCGDNPLQVRLLNELGAVNNRVTDVDRDGIEDSLHWDAYPESTAFVQIGLLHLLRGTTPAGPQKLRRE